MNITLIGAGNLATQLGLALQEKGHRFEQVFSRTAESAEALAFLLGAEVVTRPELVRPGADLYICALKDDALSDVLSGIQVGNALMVHTAGSVPMDVLSVCTSDYGVIYPLQTFSKGRKVEFRSIPFYIEAVRPESLQVIQALVADLSDTVRVVDSEHRKYIHLAAVFASNFVNYLYAISGDILQEQQLSFDDMLPLIDEVARKVHTMTPSKAQTGPAVRYDQQVMGKQLALLQNHPEWAQLYELLSKGIHKQATDKAASTNN